VRRPGTARKTLLAHDAPSELTRALDASAEDIRAGRVEDTRKFLRNARAKLDAFLADPDRRRSPSPKR
jgi:hypothetical protein